MMSLSSNAAHLAYGRFKYRPGLSEIQWRAEMRLRPPGTGMAGGSGYPFAGYPTPWL